MSEQLFAVARLPEVPTSGGNDTVMHTLRHHFGITAFGVNVWVGRAEGDRILNRHDESNGDEELYVVLSGRARFTVAGDDVDAPAGTFVYVNPEAVREAFAEEPDTTVLAVGARPGQAYVPSYWEIWSPPFNAGDHARAAAVISELLEKHSDDPNLLYNRACCRSLLGQPDEALEDLQRALELRNTFRELARGDSDFDAIRDDPRFAALVAEP